ncbi:hypothetical protein INP83_10770 [Mucilaginibacter sp. 21P]|uniref:hypothetical protein n=1 Tax=Mucilaginibacter sp. 21P TaxID=2778902 RepID=UPI001C563CB0|nr:hypothetical protein [Mucilaginibacter sp. 21P]QXV67537.1 hypothetical protein INP83_10770 [Mucilaginibacter sp. 21P]
MQKLDFVKNISELSDRLKSWEIVNTFETGFRTPSNNYDYRHVLPLVFESKSNFDAIRFDPRFLVLLANTQADEIYSPTKLTQLTQGLSHTTANNILVNPVLVSLYLFHKSLTGIEDIAKSVLAGKIATQDYQESLEDGVILFQVVIEGDGLSTEKYIKIITAIQELIETVAKLSNNADADPEIVLLDSGSDTNIGVKTAAETAKSVFLIFKEIWDFIVNFRHYKQEKNNKALLESLSIREEIKKKVNAGIISEDEAKEYVHVIKTRTDDLIGMKVLPKQIVIDTNEISNKKLIEEFEGTKLLGN